MCRLRRGGVVKNEWNTTVAQCEVLVGLEVDDPVIPSPEENLIAQIIQMMQDRVDYVDQALANVPELEGYEILAQLQKEFYEGRKAEGMRYVGDTSDKGVQLVEIKGKSVQQTTNGCQLLDYSSLDTSSKGVSAKVQSDGSIALNGTSTDTAYISIPLELNNGATVNINIGNALSNADISFKIEAADTTSCFNDSIVPLNKAFKTYTAQLLKDAVKFVIVINSDTSLNNYLIKPMIYQDGEGEWEPYTGGIPAPNPDYPMPIKNVDISNIISHGRNLLKDTTYTYTSEYTYIYSNKFVPEIFDIQPNTTYTAMFYGISLNGKQFRICDKNALNGNAGPILIQNNRAVFTTPINLNPTENNVIYVFASLNEEQKANFSNFKVMIVKGDVSEELEYETYRGNETHTDLTLAEDDIYTNSQITRKRKQITFDGSSDETWILSEGNVGSAYIYCESFIGQKPNKEQLKYCNRFEVVPQGITVGKCLFTDNSFNIWPKSEAWSDVNEFKTWLQSHPTTIEYELATPTTESLKLPTVPSYYPYTEVSTDSEVETDMTWKVLADCDNSLALEKIEERLSALEKQE